MYYLYKSHLQMCSAHADDEIYSSFIVRMLEMIWFLEMEGSKVIPLEKGKQATWSTCAFHNQSQYSLEKQ